MEWPRHEHFESLHRSTSAFFPLCSFPPAAFACNGISLCSRSLQICQVRENAASCTLSQVSDSHAEIQMALVFSGQSQIFRVDAVHANLELLLRIANSAFCVCLVWSVSEQLCVFKVPKCLDVLNNVRLVSFWLAVQLSTSKGGLTSLS